MPNSTEVAAAMARMDRFNVVEKVTITETKEKRLVAPWAGDFFGHGAPGNWASDHSAEAEKYTGWHYVAIRAIASAVRSATIEVYQERGGDVWKSFNAEDDESEPLPRWHPLSKLLRRPNRTQSGGSFREERAIQLCLTGTCLIWNVPSQGGLVAERYVIPTAIAQPRQPTADLPKGGWYINPEIARHKLESGWFMYSGLQQAIGKVIDARDVQVERFIHPVFKDDGQSPVSAGALWTDTANSIDRSRHSMMRNGISPSVVIGFDGEGADENYIEMSQKQINAKYAGPDKAGGVFFVQGKSVDVEMIGRTAQEMSYADGFQQTRDAIMAIHGVTPVAAGIEAPSGNDGLYAPLRQFIHNTVQPILDLMGEEDTEQLASLFGDGITVTYLARKIDDDALREQQINTDVAARAIEVDELRIIRGRKPWGGERGKAIAGEKPEPQQPPQQPMQSIGIELEALANRAAEKAITALENRWIDHRVKSVELIKSDCGANAEGGGGFQPGNTCARQGGGKRGSAPSSVVDEVKSRMDKYEFFETRMGRKPESFDDLTRPQMRAAEAYAEQKLEDVWRSLYNEEDDQPTEESFIDNAKRLAVKEMSTPDDYEESEEVNRLAAAVKSEDYDEVESVIDQIEDDGLRNDARKEFDSLMEKGEEVGKEDFEIHLNEWVSEQVAADSEGRNEFIDEWIEKQDWDDGHGGKAGWFIAPDDDGISHQFETASGRTFKVDIFPRTVAGIENVHVVSFADDAGSFKRTGRGEAHEVFTNVSAAVAAAIKENEFQYVSFEASGKSRKDLYDRLVRTVSSAIPGYAAAAWTRPDGTRDYFVFQRDAKPGLLQKIEEMSVTPEWLVKSGAISINCKGGTWEIFTDNLSGEMEFPIRGATITKTAKPKRSSAKKKPGRKSRRSV